MNTHLVTLFTHPFEPISPTFNPIKPNVQRACHVSVRITAPLSNLKKNTNLRNNRPRLVYLPVKPDGLIKFGGAAHGDSAGYRSWR